jgi:hypothetical protein
MWRFMAGIAAVIEGDRWCDVQRTDSRVAAQPFRARSVSLSARSRTA